jgi:hypothetical protein
MSGGGTTGAVTLTNDMASTITASGDIVVGTGSGTYDNLPIGTTGEVLTADTTVSPYKVKWAAASSGGMTSLASGNLSTGSSTTVLNTISGSYKDLRLVLRNFYQSGNGNIHIQPNSATTFVYFQTATNNTNTVTDTVNTAASTFNINYNAPTVSSSNNVAVIDFYDYTDTTINKPMIAIAEYTLASRDELTINQGVAKISGAITSITITATTNNFGGGTYELFGIK